MQHRSSPVGRFAEPDRSGASGLAPDCHAACTETLSGSSTGVLDRIMNLQTQDNLAREVPAEQVVKPIVVYQAGRVDDQNPRLP